MRRAARWPDVAKTSLVAFFSGEVVGSRLPLKGPSRHVRLTSVLTTVLPAGDGGVVGGGKIHRVERVKSKEDAHAAAHSFLRWLEELEVLE
jgi:hypothetical protein